MTPEDLLEIERSLNVQLPEDYSRVLIQYPFEEGSDPYYYSLFGKPDAIIGDTQSYRINSFFGQEWPPSFLVIGNNGAGNAYYLDLNRPVSPVFEADHEITSARKYLAVSEVASNIEAWVEITRRELEEFEAEERAAEERRRNRKWWQFWL